MVATSAPSAVVLFSGSYFDQPKRMHEYHLASALAERVPVLFVNPPTSHLTVRNRPELAATLQEPSLRRVHDRLVQLTPMVLPKPLTRATLPLTGWVVRRAIRNALGRLGLRAMAVVSVWQIIDSFDACPEAMRIHWWTDDPADGAAFWGVDQRTAVAADLRMRSRADLIISVSQAVVDEVEAGGGRASFFPNGCDPAAMLRTGEDPLALEVRLREPIAGFVGHINGRTDLRLLESVAESGMSLLIVGPHVADFESQRFAALCQRPNVQWVGPQPFERLPSYQGYFSVGLVPYADSRFNRASFPLKPLEYLAAGRPVVSTGLPGIRWLACPDIVLADDPAAFAAAAAAAARVPMSDTAVDRRRRFAQAHSWSARADTLLSWISNRGATDRSSAVGPTAGSSRPATPIPQSEGSK